MSLKSVPFALRAKARSPLHKLLFVYIVYDSGQPDDPEGFVPCLTTLALLAGIGGCDEEAAQAALIEMKADGLLEYVAFYEDGAVVAEPILPTVLKFFGGPDRG